MPWPSSTIYRLACSMHNFGMSDDVIAMTIRQTLELQDKPVDDKEIQWLVKAAAGVRTTRGYAKPASLQRNGL